ncbi:MAG: hypothetical protein ACLFP4_02775 [Spirochaetales bacterium]
MQKLLSAAIVATLLIALASCEQSAEVTDEEAKEAYAYSFVSVMTISMGAATGRVPEGITLSQEEARITLDEFDFYGFVGEESEDNVYESMSGTIVGESERLVADLTLVGGPVESISFSLGAEEVGSEEGFTTTVTINGSEMELDMRAEDIGG